MLLAMSEWMSRSAWHVYWHALLGRVTTCSCCHPALHSSDTNRQSRLLPYRYICRFPFSLSLWGNSETPRLGPKDFQTVFRLLANVIHQKLAESQCYLDGEFQGDGFMFRQSAHITWFTMFLFKVTYNKKLSWHIMSSVNKVDIFWLRFTSNGCSWMRRLHWHSKTMAQAKTVCADSCVSAFCSLCFWCNELAICPGCSQHSPMTQFWIQQE